MRAFVLLRVQPQETMTLMHEFRKNDAIIEAAVVHGPYDCMLKVVVDDIEALNNLVNDIRIMKGVLETMTCLIIQSWTRD